MMGGGGGGGGEGFVGGGVGEVGDRICPEGVCNNCLLKLIDQ